MKYNIVFRKEALQDILDTVFWYEQQNVGLGDEFFISLENEKQIIERNPYLYEEKSDGIRKAAIKRFPYLIYFIIEGKDIVIFGVLHMKRNPKIWKNRFNANNNQRS
jgi:plasmid stabilization system protein ParE